MILAARTVRAAALVYERPDGVALSLVDLEGGEPTAAVFDALRGSGASIAVLFDQVVDVIALADDMRRGRPVISHPHALALVDLRACLPH